MGSIVNMSDEIFSSPPAPKRLPAAAYISGILAGNRTRLSQAISLLESQRPSDQELCAQIIEGCMGASGNAFRVGITGVPGAGKSTLIEHLGIWLVAQQKKVAVLTTDPSSLRSGGSILGDKTRMQQLAAHPQAYIRSSPSRGTLGGVAEITYEAIRLCEAAGYEVILVETVGVGQSETLVHQLVDAFVLLLLPNAGDELQGIKKGIVELADLVWVHKSDGTQMAAARETQQQYQQALRLFRQDANGWRVPVLMTSIHQPDTLSQSWEQLRAFREFQEENGGWDQRRRTQRVYWFRETFRQRLIDFWEKGNTSHNSWRAFEEAVLAQEMSPIRAATKLLQEIQEER